MNVGWLGDRLDRQRGGQALHRPKHYGAHVPIGRRIDGAHAYSNSPCGRLSNSLATRGALDRGGPFGPARIHCRAGDCAALFLGNTFPTQPATLASSIDDADLVRFPPDFHHALFVGIVHQSERHRQNVTELIERSHIWPSAPAENRVDMAWSKTGGFLDPFVSQTECALFRGQSSEEFVTAADDGRASDRGGCFGHGDTFSYR
jgi:hypothetical protein